MTSKFQNIFQWNATANFCKIKQFSCFTINIHGYLYKTFSIMLQTFSTIHILKCNAKRPTSYLWYWIRHHHQARCQKQKKRRTASKMPKSTTYCLYELYDYDALHLYVNLVENWYLKGLENNLACLPLIIIALLFFYCWVWIELENIFVVIIKNKP